MYILCVNTLLKVRGHYDLSVLSMPVIGFQKSLDDGGGGGGGWGVISIQFFVWMFFEFFSFAKPSSTATYFQEREEACRYDGDDENNTGSTSQSEDASMKSASDDLYDFESGECLRLELSPDGKQLRNRNKPNELHRPCRSALTICGSNRRNVATNERKSSRVRSNADKKRGPKSSDRKRMHSSDENVDATHCRFKQRTSIRLATTSSSVTKSDMSREDSGLVMSPPISMSLRSSRGRAVISTPSHVSTSTPNSAVAMQTNSASSDDSCFGFKYLMPSVSLVLSPVEASPSLRMMSVTPDDSGVSLSLTQPCSTVTQLPDVPTAG